MQVKILKCNDSPMFLVSRLKCDRKVCENGGTINELCDCVCPPGYDGPTCSTGGRSGELLIDL